MPDPEDPEDYKMQFVETAEVKGGLVEFHYARTILYKELNSGSAAKIQSQNPQGESMHLGSFYWTEGSYQGEAKGSIFKTFTLNLYL